MARKFSQKLYNSRRWKECREAYAKSVGYLCEECLSKGLYTPGEIVHHKIPLTPDNIDDPSIALSFDNLELLCRECHAEKHPEIYKKQRVRKVRYKIDPYGKVTPLGK